MGIHADIGVMGLKIAVVLGVAQVLAHLLPGADVANMGPRGEVHRMTELDQP